MNPALPSGLESALARLAEGAGSLRSAAEFLHARYSRGGDSRYAGADSARAYAVTRMPATTAAVLACLRGIAPHLAGCRSQLDLGSGTGAALWAARAMIPGLARAIAVERDPAPIACAEQLWDLEPGHYRPEWRHAAIPGSPVTGAPAERPLPAADLVSAAYAFSELPESDLTAAVRVAWAATGRVLLLVEPGTPAGFAAILAARSQVLAHGAEILAPCPHAGACPMAGAAQWCHRAVRLPRSAQARAWKGGRLGFEDEKFCYLAVARAPAELPAARLIATPRVHKAAVELRLCAPGGLMEAIIPRRDQRYRAAKDLAWGDAWPAGWPAPR